VWGAKNPLREFNEITDSTSGGVEGGVRSNVGGISYTGGKNSSSSETPSIMTVKIFFS
jgi:hypothetical protein